MSKLCLLRTKACVVPMVLFAVMIGRADADDAKKTSEATKRATIRAQRPDDSRGWIIVSKESFWPLCYESLDRIREARELIGSKDQEQTADAFDKCGAWLKIAASASMADGKSGVAHAASGFEDAAISLRSESSDWTEAELSDLTTFALVAMAKSHVLRADSPDQEFKPQPTPRASKNPSVELKTAAKQIVKDKADQAIAQYHYDAMEAQRHLTVAQEYLKAAAKTGNIRVDNRLLVAVPEFKGGTASESILYVDEQLRNRIESLGLFLTEQQQLYRKKLIDRL